LQNLIIRKWTPVRKVSRIAWLSTSRMAFLIFSSGSWTKISAILSPIPMTFDSHR
jgi:hypothetical protein